MAASVRCKKISLPHWKAVGGEIVRMEWCPTMDLIALVTADSQLLVHRLTGWQRLFAHSGFDQPITCDNQHAVNA